MSTTTLPPQYAEPTATVPLEHLADLLLAQLRREREWLLEMVDQRERLLIKMGYAQGPRTAEIRRWWKEQGR